jgi:outer membrane biosynthesis protein TonB
LSTGIPDPKGQDPGGHGSRLYGSEFGSFYKVLLISVAIHVLIASLGLVFVKSTPRVFMTPTYTVEIIEAPPPRKAVKKKKTKAPAVKTKAKKTAETVSIEDAMSKIRREVQEREDDELISSRIDRLREELSKKDQEEEATKLEKKAAPKKVDVTPTANERLTREMFQDKLAPYYSKIGAIIQSSWIFPGEAEELKTLFSITISRSGKLLRVAKEEGSGNILFDESGLRAIKKSAPFPPLPDFVDGSSLEIGLRFCPECTDNEN